MEHAEEPAFIDTCNINNLTETRVTIQKAIRFVN